MNRRRPKKALSCRGAFETVVDLASVGFALILAGVAVIVAGTLLSSKGGERKVEGGAVVLVGPIPIVFGSDARWASVAIVLAIVLIVIILLFGVTRL
jgi:uncharacterized protein (TIGR00304 family)